MTESKRNVRWGILSTANIATKVSRAIDLATGAELIAIASRTEERAKSWAVKHGVSRAYESVGDWAGVVDPVEQRLHEVIALSDRGDVVLAVQAAEEALVYLERTTDIDLARPSSPTGGPFPFRLRRGRSDGV